MIGRNGTIPVTGFSHDRDGKELLPRGRETVTHTASDLPRAPAAGVGIGRETDRPLSQGTGVDGCWADGSGVRPPLRKPETRTGELAGGIARQLSRAARHWSERVNHLVSSWSYRALPDALPEDQGSS